MAHYLIHSYDTPSMAELGIPAARRYAQVAPAAPHALHMPSHIFARVGLWQDHINSNLASVPQPAKLRQWEWEARPSVSCSGFLVYAYLESGSEEEAARIIEEVKAMPPTHNMYGMDFDMRLASVERFEASYALEMHDWQRRRP